MAMTKTRAEAMMPCENGGYRALVFFRNPWRVYRRTGSQGAVWYNLRRDNDGCTEARLVGVFLTKEDALDAIDQYAKDK
jgi:hypothetical protein